MINPFFCWLAMLCAFAISQTLFISKAVDVNQYFFLPLYIIIALYTVYGIVTDQGSYLKRPVLTCFIKALGKYLSLLLILYAALSLYKVHPYYSRATVNTQLLVNHFILIYKYLGIPYHFLSEYCRSNRENMLADPFLKCLLLIKSIWGRDLHRTKRIIRHRANKRLILSVLLRFHYLPVMVEQIAYGMKQMTFVAHTSQGQLTFSQFIIVVTALAWAADSNNAATGYFWESNFTRTRFREMDPYPLHWVVTLMCYAPFIGLSNTFVPFPAPAPNYSLVCAHPTFSMVADVLVLVFLLAYIMCIATLNFSASNLCYKKIQTKGPYAFVRHPATTFKIGYFGVNFFRYANAYTLGGIAAFIFWTGIYLARVFCEERFLKRFASYRAYQKQTRYRFIPGLI
jgi:protein-S-isoprenylcysteine O-methyltransferase Ste14